MTIGIYKITNKINGRFYIGSSIDIEKRHKRHINSLEQNAHHNVRMQEDFSIYGNVFELEVIESYTSDVNRNEIYNKEQFYIRELKAKEIGYNIQDSHGGDSFTFHPNRENLIASKTAILMKVHKDMKEGRIPRALLKGEKNGNWNPNLYHNCIVCGKRLTSFNGKHGSGHCAACRVRTGEKNSFFGKTHSEKTRRKISERIKQAHKEGRAKTHKKSVFAEGKEFSSCKEFADHFGILSALVTHRVKSDKYPTWHY